MATHAAIQSAIDSFWTTHKAKFEAVQTAYAAAHGGRYWQGIITHAVVPDDGVVANPDFTRRPTDQVERWSDVFTGGRALPATNWPAAARVDVYDGPRGAGWVVTVVYTKAGERWSRSFQYGAETEREHGWTREA